MIEISSNVVFVKGAKNGAIYNLNSGNVFSINSHSCNVIEKYINREILYEDEQKYIDLLVTKKLIDLNFQPTEYIVKILPQQLEMCWLEITQNCNCRCIHCYEGAVHKSTPSSLNVSDWKKVIDQIAEIGVKHVVVIGGEPCLYKGIEEIMDYLHSYKIDTTIFTNGTCISESLYKTIVKNKIRFKCSLYGHTAEIHDSITKNCGSFEKLLKAINRLKKSGIDVAVSIIIMKENEKYYKKIQEFVTSLGVHYKFDVIREVFGGNQSTHLPSELEIIHSVMRTSPKFPKILKNRFDSAIIHNTCWYGKIAICENGDVIPCVFERKITYGNIRKNKISDILQSKELNKCWNYTFEYETSI